MKKGVFLFLGVFFLSWLFFGHLVKATPNCELISRTPSDINASSTGVFNFLVNCTDSDGINATKVGDVYSRAFTMRTVDNFLISAGPPNYFSNIYPNNTRGVVGTLNPPYKIWAGVARNIGLWFDNLGYNDTLNNDTFSYSVQDRESRGIIITNTTPTEFLINFTGIVEINCFRTSWYLCSIAQTSEEKKNFTLNNNVLALAKRFDAEAYRGQDNYTMNIFINVHNDGTTNRNLLVYYCNESYSPAGGVRLISSPNCNLIQSLDQTEVNTKIFTRLNSSYIKLTEGVLNGYLGGIKTTKEYYVGFDISSNIPQSTNSYKLRYMNGTVTVTDPEFYDSNTAWSSTNDGRTWTQSPLTFDIFSTAVRTQGTETLEFGLYVEDLLGNAYYNSSIFTDVITQTSDPISGPAILEYNSSTTMEDFEINSTHSGIMNIYIGVAIDPDSVGNVTHNLTLRNIDGSYNYTINGSFKSADDSDVWIDFNTSLVPDGVYRMNVTAIAGDDLTDVESFLTGTNFTINNSDTTYPLFSDYSDNNASFNDSGIGLFNVTVENTNGTVFLEINGTNTTATNLSLNVYNASYNFTANGTYEYKWYAYGNGSNNLINVSVARTYFIDYSTNTTVENPDSGSNSATSINSGYISELLGKEETLNLKILIFPNKKIMKRINQEKGTGIKEIEIRAEKLLRGDIEIYSYNEVSKFCEISSLEGYKIYKVLNFNTSFLDDNSIKSVRLKIGVSKSWISGNNVSDIKVIKCYPEYGKISSEFNSESAEEKIYDVHLTGFSAYAILGILPQKEKVDDEKRISQELIEQIVEKEDSIKFVISWALVLLIIGNLILVTFAKKKR